METMRRQDRRASKRKSNIGLWIAGIFLLVVLGALFGGKVYIDKTLNRDGFYPGIVIDGVSLDGKTMEEAMELLSSVNQPRLDDIRIELKYQDKNWTFGYKDIEAGLNIQEELDKAYQIGRTGNILERLREVKNVEKNGYEAKTTVYYKVESLQPKLAEIKKEIDKEAIDATVKFNPSASKKFTFTNEREGYVLDDQQLFEEIKSGIGEDWKVALELEPQVVEPKVYRADLEKATKEIASFSTDLGSSSAERRHNVEKSIKEFNGMVIQPGQTVSFNETTGPRTLERGYKNAPVIKADKSLEDGPGGGVCQSSTTLYNAFLKAGLEIVQRSHHSFPSTYVDIGFDATVNYPNLDLKVKNNRSTPIFIQTYISGNQVKVIIYGEPLENGRKIRLESEIYQTYEAPAPTIIKDKTGQYVTYEDEKFEKVKSRKGYKVRTYKIVYEGDKVISKEVIANDYYKPIKGTTYVGVKKRPVVKETPNETKEPAETGNNTQA